MKKINPKSFATMLCILVTAFSVAACKVNSFKSLIMPSIEGASYVGSEACGDCHEELGDVFTETIHGRLASFELVGNNGGCESCHGPGSVHIDTEDPANIFHPDQLKAEELGAVCMTCHDGGETMEWEFSQHALADVSCADCHSLHSKDTLKKETTELCLECHQDYQAKINMPSHHPIIEGKMTCTDCHNPHGDMLKADSVNELCLECHARYQGPYMFEHAPVQEDCSICHDAHGSVAANLLTQNEPFLCLQCHESHFHTTRIGSTLSNPNGTAPGLAFDGNAIEGNTPPDDNTVKPIAGDTGIDFSNEHGEEGWRMAFGTRCSVCHTQVHGSDLPSQSAPTTNSDGTKGWPGGGAGLTR